MLVIFTHARIDVTTRPVAQTEMPAEKQLNSLQYHKKAVKLYNEQNK